MKISFRCVSHAYCAMQRREWWKTWSPWAVGSDAGDCIQSLLMDQRDPSRKILETVDLQKQTRVQLTRSQHAHHNKAGLHLDQTSQKTFLMKSNQPFHHAWKPQAEVESVRTDPASASIKRIRQTNNTLLTQKNIEYYPFPSNLQFWTLFLPLPKTFPFW